MTQRPTEYPRKNIAARDLRIGDVINIGSTDAFSDAIVKNVTDDNVELFRPYGSHHDFTTASGIICLVGTEKYSIPRNDHEYYVYRRPNNLR